MIRLFLILLMLISIVSGVWRSGSIAPTQEMNTPSFFWRAFLKTGSGTRAAICRALAPIRLGWRKPLVSEQNIAYVKQYLEPGDIILTRDNLKLSSHFIPGFWTHASLYLGEPSEFNDYFSDIWMKKRDMDKGDADQFVTFPMQAMKSKCGTVIEAVVDGVRTSPLDYGPMDYLAVLRPILPKKAKLAALSAALEYEGKAYDFHFDFDSKDALICSELIYQAYLPAKGKTGLWFQLYTYDGRRYMSVNDIAKKFSMEYGTAKQQLDCVIFIDGSNDQLAATVDYTSAFRNTCRALEPQ